MAERSHQVHPYRDTAAAQMLARGLRQRHEEGVSLRQLAQRLSYKQAVVLSHMATGRVPIPIDRAADLAREVGLPDREFLMACVRQRHPEVDWNILTDGRDEFASELAAIADCPLDDLSVEHRWVLREVVAESRPSRRWLKVAELSAIELLRELRPNLFSEGLSSADRRAVRDALG